MLGPVLVIIPALNEEETVGTVVRAVLEHVDADVLVVDDGSSDRTAVVAAAAGATVLSHPFNLGVGVALRTGFRYACTHGYAAAVQVDGDGQHEVADAKRLLDVVASGGADIVVGSRFSAGYEVSRARHFGMRMLSRRVSRYLGVPISDTTSGFRAFSRRAIERFASAYPSAYLSDTVEAMLMAKDWGLVVAEVPVSMHPRQGGQPSSGRGASIFHLTRLMLVIALHRARRPIFGQTPAN